MEDLVPLVIFIIIVIVNVFKGLAGKGKGGKPVQPKQPAPQQENPSTIEQFFETIAEQMAPKPTPLPDWPDQIDRPDYVKEMDEFEHVETVNSKESVLAEPPPRNTKPAPISAVKPAASETRTIQPTTVRASLKSAIQSTPSIFSSSNGMRLPSTAMMNSGTAGRIDFSLKNRSDLKQAMIANLIFSSPRAYDRSFDNTMAK